MTLPRNHSLLTAYTILFTTASGIIGYDLCTHQPPPLPDVPVASARIEPVAQPVADSSPAADLIVTTVPSPIVTQEPAKTAAPVTKPARIAPAGVLYLTSRISLTDDSGVRALKPGTRVRLVLRKGAKLKVSDSGTTFLVDASQVTNNVDLAEALLAENSVPSALTARRN